MSLVTQSLPGGILTVSWIRPPYDWHRQFEIGLPKYGLVLPQLQWTEDSRDRW